MQSSLLKSARIVAAYAPIRNEVPTQGIVQGLTKFGCRVVYPRIQGCGLDFAGGELIEGRWGIPEPQAGKSVPISQVDAVLVPGVAFDERGARIGQGGGYYDRAMRGFDGLIIGLAYEFQLSKRIPEDEHDIRCNWVVTESRLIKGK